MKDSIKCGGIVIIQNEKVLLVKHGPKADHISDTFGIPSGRLLESESYINGAIRELKEETNLETNPNSLIELSNIYTAYIPRKNGEIKTFTMKVFKCNEFTGEIKSNNETIPIRINISNIDKLNLLPNTLKIIHDSLNIN